MKNLTQKSEQETLGTLLILAPQAGTNSICTGISKIGTWNKVVWYCLKIYKLQVISVFKIISATFGNMIIDELFFPH